MLYRHFALGGTSLILGEPPISSGGNRLARLGKNVSAADLCIILFSVNTDPYQPIVGESDSHEQRELRSPTLLELLDELLFHQHLQEKSNVSYKCYQMTYWTMLFNPLRKIGIGGQAVIIPPRYWSKKTTKH